jgi:hypothetical protein
MVLLFLIMVVVAGCSKASKTYHAILDASNKEE